MVEIQPRRLSDFEPLTPAEQKVLEELDTGEFTVLGDGEVPGEDACDDCRLRARFVRWLALGCEGSDEHRLHETGLQVEGALIAGEGDGHREHAVLNLQGCEVGRDLLLARCRFAAAPNLLGARMQGLYLDGSHLPGLTADGLETRGDVFLRRAETLGEVRLLGARIGGNLECDGAKLRNAGGSALNAEGARVQGAFFLRLNIPRGHVRIEGRLDLTAAEIGHINDHPGSWPKEAGSLALNRCVYGAFTGHGVSAKERLDWLELQDPSPFGKEFLPQPYEQCAKVLREMGHVEDAREILIEKERRQRAALRRRLREGGGRRGRLRATWSAFWDGFLGGTVRYGQRPLFAILWLLGLGALGAVVFWGVWEAGQFKPNNPGVLASAEWYGCAQSAPPGQYLALAGESQLGCFLRQPQAQGFPEFNAGVYAFDVLLPVIDVEQQSHWVPDEDQWGGWFAKGWLYVEIFMGWLLSLLAVAGLSGLIRSD